MNRRWLRRTRMGGVGIRHYLAVAARARRERCVAGDRSELHLLGVGCFPRTRNAFAPARHGRLEGGSSAKRGRGDAANREFSALLTFFWLCAMGVFPQEIIDDFKAFYGEFDIPRLNPDWPSSDESKGALRLPPECGRYTFRDVELAPGCAVMVQRYARYVCHF